MKTTTHGIGFSYFLAALVPVLASCGTSNSNSNNDSGNTTQAVLAAQAISVDNATSAQCPVGGRVYHVYTDKNANGALDQGEPVLSSQTVCNGQNGSNGTNGRTTLASMTRVSTQSSACSSLKGIQINTGLDVNSNGTLENSEISQSQILCDGRDGAPGAAGPAGANGKGVAFKMVPASYNQCPTGGTLVMMSTDVDNSGVWRSTNPNQQSAAICNGSSSITAYTPVDVIIPCGETIPNKEVLFLLANGDLLGTVSANASGDLTGLSLLANGSYRTTDGTNCSFDLFSNGSGDTRYIRWFGQIQDSWPVY